MFGSFRQSPSLKTKVELYTQYCRRPVHTDSGVCFQLLPSITAGVLAKSEDGINKTQQILV